MTLFLGKTPAPVVHPTRGDWLDVILAVMALLYAIKGVLLILEWTFSLDLTNEARNMYGLRHQDYQRYG